MRISDWSSDVCSSDLAGICGSLRPRRNKPRRGVAIAGAAAGSFALGALALGLLVIARRRRRLVPVDRLRRRGRVRRVPDRKGVVSGKRVSGRVELGGRLMFKKQTLRCNKTDKYSY